MTVAGRTTVGRAGVLTAPPSRRRWQQRLALAFTAAAFLVCTISTVLLVR